MSSPTGGAQAAAPVLSIRELAKSYGSGKSRHEVFNGIDLQIGDGEFVCIVGPSGCGKTTLLRCIAGLIAPTEGVVSLSGRTVRSPDPAMAMVFQDYGRSLLPWITVDANVGLPLRHTDVPRDEQRSRVESTLAEVGLADARHRYPWQLSGGMQQRVAIARALAVRPQILLMDEPFASVDAQTREDLEDLIASVRVKHQMTVLFVTHDIDEAIYLGDRVVVLSKSPTTIRATHEVSIDAPRDQILTKGHPRFVELRALVRQQLRAIPATAPTKETDQ